MRVFQVPDMSGRFVKSWCDNPESSAIDQARNLARLPFLFMYPALMPDAHAGKGMPIGAVLATKGTIIPNAVGSDIGCGMIAYRTNIPFSDLSVDQYKQLHSTICEYVPVGTRHHDKAILTDDGMPTYSGYMSKKNYPVVSVEFESAMRQIGTLGGGK